MVNFTSNASRQLPATIGWNDDPTYYAPKPARQHSVTDEIRAFSVAGAAGTTLDSATRRTTVPSDKRKE
ncbi:hypothetical protein LCH21_00600 [Patescibacteria group bacterium]|nr:hypothetical protein [Patescibacteria group bacterium]